MTDDDWPSFDEWMGCGKCHASKNGRLRRVLWCALLQYFRDAIYPIACQDNRRFIVCRLPIGLAGCTGLGTSTSNVLGTGPSTNKNAIRRQTNYNYIVACFPIDRLFLVVLSVCTFLQIKGDLRPRSQSLDILLAVWGGPASYVMCGGSPPAIDDDVRNIKSHDLFCVW